MSIELRPRNLCGSCAQRWVRGLGKGCPVDRAPVAEIVPLKRDLVAGATPTLKEEGEELMKKMNKMNKEE